MWKQTASDSPATANEGQSIREGRWCCIKKIFTATAADCGSHFLACAEIIMLNLTFRRLENCVLSAREKESLIWETVFFLTPKCQNTLLIHFTFHCETYKLPSSSMWSQSRVKSLDLRSRGTLHFSKHVVSICLPFFSDDVSCQILFFRKRPRLLLHDDDSVHLNRKLWVSLTAVKIWVARELDISAKPHGGGVEWRREALQLLAGCCGYETFLLAEFTK